IPTIAEDDAKEAFVQYVTRKRCYNKTPAREMVITDLQPLNTYRYRLETFTESRSASWKSESYWGEVIDSPQNGAAPLPWAIRVDVPDMDAQDASVQVEKHAPCAGARKQGKQKIFSYIFFTAVRYVMVREQQHVVIVEEKHSYCHTLRCKLNGKKNNIFEYEANQRTGFPIELFQGVNGKTLFVEEQTTVRKPLQQKQISVYPVLGFPESAINQISRTAIEQHQTQFASTTRILRQVSAVAGD
ncbi:hypothetical protein JD844_012956, partial [Phrynosoma platyrhinos]